MACTSPQYAPWPRGSSTSCITTTRGPGLAATCSHQANSLERWPSTGCGSARISAVTAYPTVAGRRGKRQTMSEDTKPVLHGLTLNVSIALATVGDEMRDSSDRILPGLGRGHASSVCWRCQGSDRLLPALAQDLPDLLQDGFDLGQIGIHGQRLLEVLRGAREVLLLEVDQAEARQRPEVDGFRRTTSSQSASERSSSPIR